MDADRHICRPRSEATHEPSGHVCRWCGRPMLCGWSGGDTPCRAPATRWHVCYPSCEAHHDATVDLVATMGFE